MNKRLLLQHLVQDQYEIWRSPLHIGPSDAKWLLPLASITTGLLLTDRTTQPEISRFHPGTAAKFSDIGLATYAGGLAGFYLYGHAHASHRAQETGLLAAEAGINGLVIGEGLKLAFQRERPNTGDGKGHFFRSTDSSFYSVHSTITWSFASVIAHEYPGWLSQTLSYGAASAISFSRVAAEKHFPSDIFVGAVAGYLIGRHVYNIRHDPAIDAEYGTFVTEYPVWSSRNAGTTYVPLDSWVYPALDRLIAYGFVRYQILGLRPWTRTAIRDMLTEANDRMQSDERVPPEIQRTYSVLASEFTDELALQNSSNKAFHVDSLYERTTQISGPPLNDSYHFGQTIINDYGRPYQRGYNQLFGFSARAEQGRFSFYFRGEYQHSPSAPPYSLPVRQVIAEVDGNPVQPAIPFREVNTFRILDAYASLTLAGNVVSVGKQNYWWGPDQGSAMILSNNAEPFYSLRINRAIPFKLPWIFKYLGPMRYDAFFGQLQGHQFPPRPFIHGEKISLKPTENLELGFSRTAVFAGEGLTPLTFGTFWNSFTSVTSSNGLDSNLKNSPGVRHGQFDFSYRLPGLRNWVTIYSDSLVHDDISPIDAPRRAAWNPGLYVSHLPKFSKVDLRIEAVNTDPPITNSTRGSFFYWEVIYHDLYLNKKSLLGSWVGREGKGFQACTTYWLSTESTLQFKYRNTKVAKDFIPAGETSNIFSVGSKVRLKSDIEIASSLQYERWKAPVLVSGVKSDVAASVQVTYWPRNWKFISRR